MSHTFAGLGASLRRGVDCVGPGSNGLWGVQGAEEGLLT